MVGFYLRSVYLPLQCCTSLFNSIGSPSTKHLPFTLLSDIFKFIAGTDNSKRHVFTHSFTRNRRNSMQFQFVALCSSLYPTTRSRPLYSAGHRNTRQYICYIYSFKWWLQSILYKIVCLYLWANVDITQVSFIYHVDCSGSFYTSPIVCHIAICDQFANCCYEYYCIDFAAAACCCTWISNQTTFDEVIFMKEQRQMRQANNAVQQQFNSDNTLKSNKTPHLKYFAWAYKCGWIVTAMIWNRNFSYNNSTIYLCACVSANLKAINGNHNIIRCMYSDFC